jgi:hypothetical protein
VRQAHPWIQDSPKGVKAMKELSPTPGMKGGPEESRKLAEAGFALPPFHYRCRCSVEVTDEAGSFDPAPGWDKAKPPTIGGKVPPPLDPRKPSAKVLKPVVKLPKTVVTPTKPFNKMAFAKALQQFSPRGPYKKAAQEAIRREMNAMMVGEGCVPVDLVKKNAKAAKVTIRNDLSAGGWHCGETGEIRVKRIYAIEGSRFGVAIEKGIPITELSRGEKYAAELFVHESLHGCSPMAAPQVVAQTARFQVAKYVYKGWGAVMEEAQVHAGAKYLTRKHFGIEYVFRGGSYDRYLDATKKAIVDSVAKTFAPSGMIPDEVRGRILQWSEKAASKDGLVDIIGETAVKMRSTTKFTTSRTEYLKMFTDKVELPSEFTAGLSKNELADKMKKFREVLQVELKKNYQRFAR